ncbi:hypothetical protein EG68_10276 [Paragonimus skrjabini miyazakii]|uniref:Uncharacterized protein n=1 Tax=Paragonimus skrjabini miyazakii TaxID=59628 RepID=A0A8S9YDQ7_9TREM|nr:hypothetical protein EG68_10276 [Paragonimus skrjabini miyazakii]
MMASGHPLTLKTAECDFVFKVVVTGNAGVGKSSLALRFVTNKFNVECASTCGVEFVTKLLNIENKLVNVQIWDTVGQETYKSLPSSYYRGALGALIVFDITDEKSFNDVTMWLEELKKFVDPDVQVLLIGNKCDLKHERKVSVNKITRFASSKGLLFMETSARDGTSVDEAFTHILKGILDLAMNSSSKELIPRVQLNQLTEKHTSAGCC